MNEFAADIPTFDRMLWPALVALREAGGECSNGEMLNRVAALVRVPEAAQTVVHTGRLNQSELDYRLAWTRTYLKKFGAIENVGRGKWRITPSGESLNEMAVTEIPSFVRSGPTAEPPQDEAEDGTEAEDVGTIGEPFDPNKIRVRLWTPTLDLLMKRIAQDEIDLAAGFQRKAGIWDDGAQSRLIESLLIRIPLPAFYMDGKDDESYVVIDGIQRLTSVKRFMLDGSLKLRGLEFLRDLAGKGFADLSRPLKRRIEETMVTVYVVEAGTPDEAKLNIFKRINTGGQPLRPQEIRHAMSPGPVRDFLARLAQSESFVKATDRGVSDARMDDRECVARFAAFYLTPPERYTHADLDAFVLAAMKSLNSMTEEDREDLRRRFERSLDAAYRVFGVDAFRKRTDPDHNRRPVNKALFESWLVNFARLESSDLEKVESSGGLLAEAQMEVMTDEPDFMDAISQGTGDVAKVRLRFRRIREIIASVLQ